jgi:hypothetical protein
VAALVAVIVLFLSSPGGSAAPAGQPRTLLYDPGPAHRCWSVAHESYGGTSDPDTSGCAALDTPERTDSTCTWFPYEGRYGHACPGWRFVTRGWNGNDSGQRPGYNTSVHGRGSSLTLTMKNDAEDVGDCDLYEVAFSYEYTGSSLRRNPTTHQPYDFSDGRLKVSYDAYVDRSGEFGCAEKRAILTTDLIYYAHGKKNVISVIHYDPGHFAGSGRHGRVLWSNHCSDGCRIAVPGQPVTPGKTTPVSVDFTALASAYSAYLGGAVPKASRIEAVQVVNSTRGADLETRVSHADVTLDPPG